MTAIPDATIPAVDPIAVDFCADGYIPLAKLTTPERDAVVVELTGRGYGPTVIAHRVHGTVAAVHAALYRVRYPAAGGGG